jgi:predicted nucleic acid-binding protein
MRQNASAKGREALELFLQDVRILDAPRAVAAKFDELRAAVFDAGQRAPDMDLWIASTALVFDLTLVTHNAPNFADIPNLRIQDLLGQP